MNPLCHMLTVPSGMKPNNEFGLISTANPLPAWEVSIQKAKARSAKVEKVSMTTRTKRARESIWVKVKALDPDQRPEAVFNVVNEVICPPTVPIVTKRHGSPEKQSKGDREMEKERIKRKERRVRKEIKVERVK